LAPALAETVAKGIFCSSGGNSGVNTDAAMRGAKSQSLKIALNCGSAVILDRMGDRHAHPCTLGRIFSGQHLYKADNVIVRYSSITQPIG